VAPCTISADHPHKPSHVNPLDSSSSINESTSKHHRSGDRHPPCGHPFTGLIFILDSSVLALTILFDSIYFIHPIAISLTLLSFAALTIVLKAVLSKSPSISINTAIAVFRFLLVFDKLVLDNLIKNTFKQTYPEFVFLSILDSAQSESVNASSSCFPALLPNVNFRFAVPFRYLRTRFASFRSEVVGAETF
jgi:hypothetical protein